MELTQQHEVESAPVPALAPVLHRAVLAAIDTSTALNKLHPNGCNTAPPNQIGAAYLSMVMEYRESALLLVRHGAFSSAYALARPAYETCCRGLWAKFVARQKQLKALIDGIPPAFETIGKELATSDKAGPLAQVRSVAWKVLSDHAHGGPMHLCGWISRAEIGQQIHPEHVANLLLLFDIYGYYATYGLLACADCATEPANEVYMELIAPRVTLLREPVVQAAGG